MSGLHYRSVDELVAALKRIVNGQPALQNIAVDGEVLKARMSTNGHLYFTLKDSAGGGEIGCVVWASTVRRLSWLPKNGDRITVTGTVEIKYTTADLKLYAVRMEPAGIAQFYLQYQQLRAKLEKEGLFDPAHKKPLPKYPMDIAVVTGDGTSGYQDVMHWLQQRWPVARVKAYPCMVQGNSAPRDIIRALLSADQCGHDVILLVRGGGGFMELFCFNDEQLARCIYSLSTPVVTGIGHEDDTTIADSVADLRTNVPSAAVVESTPDIREVLNMLGIYENNMRVSMNNALERRKAEMSRITQMPVWSHPERLYEPYRLRLNNMEQALMTVREKTNRERTRLNGLYQQFQSRMTRKTQEWDRLISRSAYELETAMRSRISSEQIRCTQYEAKLNESIHSACEAKKKQFLSSVQLLDALSPLSILSRGYSVVLKDGAAIRQVQDAEPGDLLTVRLSDGELLTEMKGKTVYDERSKNI